MTWPCARATCIRRSRSPPRWRRRRCPSSTSTSAGADHGAADTGPAAYAAADRGADQADVPGARRGAGRGRARLADRRARRRRLLPAPRHARERPAAEGAVNHDEQLQWEARWARPAAIAAFLAGALLLVSSM